MRFSQLLALGATFSTGVSALPAVTRVGRYLYSGGNRFYIKGVSYQQQATLAVSTDPNAFPEPSTYIDPLVNADYCNRDIPYLKQLNINAIRVYSVDSTQNHDACMQALSAAGIYTIIDLSLPVNGSINRASPSWQTNLLDLYLTTIDAFSKYDNVLAYNVGNEVVTNATTTNTAPFIKAAARDVKAYLNSKSSSALVGYASTNGDTWLPLLANYLSCDSANDSIDLFGLNDYNWCGTSTYSAAYASTNSEFTNYNVAAYFSEFGCITAGTRPWTEVPVLFGSQMNPVWSGGLAFNYFPTADGYGMVTISTDNKTVTPSQDFTNLVGQYSNLTTTNSPTQSSAAASTYPACVAPDGVNFLGSSTLPPTPNAAACTCADKTAFSCVFTPQTSNYSAIVGDLLNYACSQLGSQGDSCAPIASDGANGTYGRFATCDPSTQLSWAMSEVYENSNRAATACSFSGNATVNKAAPPTLASAQAVASACASQTGVFVPPAPTSPVTAGGSGGSGGSGGGKHNGADSRSVIGMGAMLAAVVAGGAWTLL